MDCTWSPTADTGLGAKWPRVPVADYYDLLSNDATAVDIWITQYLHVLHGKDSVVQWAKGTSLRPYLDALRPSDRSRFIAAYSEALRPHYQSRAGGTVLLPFRRLSILARK